MSIETTIQHSAASAWRLPATAAVLVRFVRATLKAHHAENELNDLSDRDLRDIGVHRAQIAELVKREAERTLLLQAGWPHQPR